MESEVRKIIKDNTVTAALNMWSKTKRWGLPFAGGWAEQPAWVMDILDAAEECDLKFKATKNG
jgi:hypothetical protein